MEPLAEAQLPVTVNVSGDPALGFAARPLETTPATITVRGPISFVRQTWRRSAGSYPFRMRAIPSHAPSLCHRAIAMGKLCPT